MNSHQDRFTILAPLRSPTGLAQANNDAGNGHVGLAALIEQGMVGKLAGSFARSTDPHVFTEKSLAGEIRLELVPEGTPAGRIRAGGAGIPVFFTPTSMARPSRRGSPWKCSTAGLTCASAG
jgi:3-oxoadipate CoA-transferase, alpha subunit